MNGTRGFQRLRATELADWLGAHPDALILDARDERHHAQGHLKGSMRLDGRNHERLLMREDKHRPVLVYCYHGNASQTYADMFVDFGFAKVCDVVGGWDAWQQLALTKPPQQAAPADPPAPVQTWLQAHGFTHIDQAGAHGNTPLMTAAWRGHTAMVQALLDLGVRLDAVNEDGNNALWLACVSHDPALVALLAQAGVPINHVNVTGATCLMYAASSSKPDIVRVLLAAGADPLIQTQDDFSALDMAASLACLQLLRTAVSTAKKERA